MRLRCGVASAALLAAVGFAAPARAQYVDWRTTMTLTGAYTRILSDGQLPTALTYAGPSISFSPGLVGLFDTPRTENSLTYGLSLTLPFNEQLSVQQSALTYANRLTYAGHYALSEIASMTFSVGVTQAPLFSLVPSQDSTSASIQPVPAGLANMITTTASEGFLRQVSGTTSFSQGGSFAFGDPIDPGAIRARTFSASNSFGLTRTFSANTVGLTLNDQINYFTASQGDAVNGVLPALTPSGSIYVNTLALNWWHQFSERLSGVLIAGATQTLSPGTTTMMEVQPTGSLTLNYEFNIASAALSAAHVAQTNLATATVSFNDTAALRFSLPIGVTGLVSSGAVGYTHGVPIPSAATPLIGGLVGPSSVFVGDAALAYTPRPVPTLTVGVRGLLTRQVLTESVANNFTSYSVALNLTYSYPSATAALMRPSFSPLYSAQPPSPSDVISTERYFSAGVSGPAPAEPLPLPKGP